MSIRRRLGDLVNRRFPSLWYLRLYKRAAKTVGDSERERVRRFDELLAASNSKRCLQISARGKKFGPDWICVDLYDHADYVDFNYDVHDMGFEDGSFDVVVCNAVLEHVENPTKAIAELERVLAPGGDVWVEVPFNQPFHGAPADFWRVTLPAMRIWMSAFDEIASGYCMVRGSSIYNYVYFQGRKPG